MPDAPRHHTRHHAPRDVPVAGSKPAHALACGAASQGSAEPHAHVNLDRCRLSLIKGEHRWRFRWERGSEAALISAVADLARNPQMNFDWFDAAVVCRHIAQGLPRRGQAGGNSAVPAPRSSTNPKK